MNVCGTPLGPNANPPFGRVNSGVADVERELAVEDVEPLVLVRVDVPGEAFTGAHLDLEETDWAAAVFTADLDGLEHAEQPMRLAFLRPRPYPSFARSAATTDTLHFSLSDIICNCLRANGCIADYPIKNDHLSSPSAERLRAWRLFFGSALALIDVLDSESTN